MSTPTRPRHPAGHVFSRVGMVVSILVIIGVLAGSAFYAASLSQSSQMAAVISATLVDLTNEDREKRDLPALTLSPILTAAAQAKADDMAAKGYFAHTSPEGRAPWYWFSQVGYDYIYAGENLAVKFSDSKSVERAWMESPKHRDNILNGRYTEVGIATATGTYEGKETTFVVQMFGTPKTKQISPISATPAEPAVVAVAPELPPPPQEPQETAPADTVVLGTEATAVEYAAPVEQLLVSPQTLLHIIYLVCAGIIILALILTTRLELRKHHAPHALAACLLFIVMLGCLIVADRLIFVPPIVG